MLSDKLTFKKSCTNLVGVTAEWTENVGLKMSKTGDPILQYSEPKNFLKPQQIIKSIQQEGTSFWVFFFNKMNLNRLYQNTLHRVLESKYFCFSAYIYLCIQGFQCKLFLTADLIKKFESQCFKLPSLLISPYRQNFLAEKSPAIIFREQRNKRKSATERSKTHCSGHLGGDEGFSARFLVLLRYLKGIT